MPASDYLAKIDKDNAANLRASRNARDISGQYHREAPTKSEIAVRTACERDFRLFCESYFPAAFCLPWSADHLRVIARIESAVLEGGLFAVAMPRGAGKTTLCERAALWALLYGHRRFVSLIGSTETNSSDRLDDLKTELACNEHLRRPFRAVTYPIRRLENNARKCIGQLFDGEQTRIGWGAKRLELPTLPVHALDGADVSGSVVTVAGLTGSIRGQTHTLPSGEVIRPELVLLDDPQTRESASSVSQCAERLSIIRGDVLGMAGPGRKVSALMPCTVIREGDLADELLNRETNPAWQGERTSAVYAWPTNESLWEKYHSIRADGLRAGDGGKAATEFYRSSREAMDAGSSVAWSDRFNPDELSAIQHCENLRSDLGESAFAAEYQNAPIRAEADDVITLTVAEIASKVNGIKRGFAPVGAEHLTAFIDVHDNLLFWCVVAWASDFTGWVIDYGTYPDQKKASFTLRKANPTLKRVAPGAGREGAIRSGLDKLAETVISREFKREDGVVMRVDRCLVDAGYVPDVVHDFCRHSSQAAILIPSLGKGIGPADRPMNEYTRHRGDRLGLNWYIPAPARGRVARYIRFDTNHWKTFIHARFAVALGDHGALSIWGRDPNTHRLFAEHTLAEPVTRTTGKGRVVDVWKQVPNVDNHWFDCIVGCAVGASMQGVALPSVGGPSKESKRPKISLSELQRMRRKNAR